MKTKFTRKFIILSIALLLTVVAIGTGTYAWFSMNKKVDAAGMNISTSAPTNMLITTDPTVADPWKNGVTSVYVVPNKFFPVSTTNGKDFFAISSTDGIDILGGIIDEENRAEVQLAKVDRQNGDNLYYAEFPLYIKATMQGNVSEDFKMTLNEITVGTTANNLYKTVRVAISYVDPYGSTSTDADTGKVTINDDGTVEDTSSNLLTESTPVVYKYDTETNVLPVASLSGGNSGTAELADSDPATTAGAGDVCFEVDYTAQHYTTVIVRIWFEGQHTDCKNKAATETVSVSLNWRVKES